MAGFRKMRAILTICAALGWWGVWFPELAVWTDAVCVIPEKKEMSVQWEENVVEYKSVSDIYKGLMQADKEQIRVKSRLLEIICSYFEKRD